MVSRWERWVDFNSVLGELLIQNLFLREIHKWDQSLTSHGNVCCNRSTEWCLLEHGDRNSSGTSERAPQDSRWVIFCNLSYGCYIGVKWNSPTWSTECKHLWTEQCSSNQNQQYCKHWAMCSTTLTMFQMKFKCHVNYIFCFSWTRDSCWVSWMCMENCSQK